MSFVLTHPEIAAQWHPTLNGDKKSPQSYLPGSSIIVWWRCPKSCPQGCPHDYQAAIRNRCEDGTGCHFCVSNTRKFCIHMSIYYTHPDAASLWDPYLNLSKHAIDGELSPGNQVPPTKFVMGSHHKAFWMCKQTCSEGCFHQWQASIDHITSDTSCPGCSGRKVCCVHMSFAHTHPNIASELHPTKNGDLDAKKISYGSSKQAVFRCPNKTECGCVHEYSMTIAQRCISEQGCPYCSTPRKKHCEHESIRYTHPHLVPEWHERNSLQPTDVTFGSPHKVNWCCVEFKHIYEASVSSRTAGSGCPHCKHKTERKLFEILKAWFPDVVAQFKIPGCKNKKLLRFDFCIPSIKLIIELDGRQHFLQVSCWTSPEDSIKLDVYKMTCAEESGYKVVRIFQEDVWNRDESWLSETLLPELKGSTRSHAFISLKSGLYKGHQELLIQNQN
jgi:very-short-patch-repair endonuclease